MKKQTLATLKKGLMACGAAMLLAGINPLSAQLYTDAAAAPQTTTGTAVGTGYVGIGGKTPSRQFEIQNANNATANTWFVVTNVEQVTAPTTSAPGFLMRRARGTATAGVISPANVLNGDRIGFFLAAGYHSGSWLNAAGITFKVDGAPATGVMPVSMEFEVGAPRTTKMKLSSNGKLWVQTLADVGEYVMVDTDGTLTTGPVMPGGGGSNWDAPSGAGAGEGHIWFSQGAAAADSAAVVVDFSLNQNNSMGIVSAYSGAATSTADPIGVLGVVDAGPGYGIGVAGAGSWVGVWGESAVWGLFSNGDAIVQGDLTVTGTVTSSSDARLKKNVNTLDGAMANIMKLQPKTYQYRTNEYPTMNLAEGLNFGFIAQELQQVFPNLVLNSTTYGDKNKASKFDFLSVNYTGLIPVMVSAMQEQQASIDNLSERLDKVEELLKKKN